MGSAVGSKKFKVALIQMKPKVLDPEFNFAHAKSELTKAAEGGASLAILPEYHLTGWEPRNPQFAELAKDAHKYEKQYQDLAKELNINICAGTICYTVPGQASNGTSEAGADANEKPNLLNISPFISQTGELLGSYTKVNLWIPEREHLTSSVEYAQTPNSTVASEAPTSKSQTARDLQHAGVAHSEPSNPPMAPHEVIQTPLGKIGVLICWDLAFPEAFRSLIRQDCKIIMIPTFWKQDDMMPAGLELNPDAEKLFLESTLVARAYENTCMIIFCNAGGPKEEGYLGLSGVYAPIVGRVKGSFTDGEEGMRIVDVDLGIQELAEQNYRVREDMKGDDWHYGYDKVKAGGRAT